MLDFIDQICIIMFVEKNSGSQIYFSLVPFYKRNFLFQVFTDRMRKFALKFSAQNQSGVRSLTLHMALFVFLYGIVNDFMCLNNNITFQKLQKLKYHIQKMFLLCVQDFGTFIRHIIVMHIFHRISPNYLRCLKCVHILVQQGGCPITMRCISLLTELPSQKQLQKACLSASINHLLR